MNIIDKIKVGDILYSTIAGEIIITQLNSKNICDNHITGKNHLGLAFSFNKEGKYYTEGECVLFPSKENRDWSTYNPKFNINTLESFDKVLVRDKDNHCWMASLYSHYEDYGEQRFYIANNMSWNQCVPYNEETKHLVGTAKMPDNKYINW
jgi:hypothetical protein